jgi:tyrosyl-tRNA synthetase
MQAYDSVILRADIEIGGSDQKFNLLAGRELQKKLGQEAQEIITTELLVGTDGHEKMSKSYDNYIGIAEAPEEIFGKIMSIKDEQIIEYFRLLTDLSPKKVENIKADLLSGANPKYIKYQLGLEITTLYCGAGEAKKAGERFDLIHKLKETPKDIPEVTLSGSFELAKLVSTLGLARSVSEAYRLIVQGGVRIDEAKIVDPKNLIKVYPGMIIQVGKRKFIKIK